nr:hypothetical protein [Anaerolineae bacterium]
MAMNTQAMVPLILRAVALAMGVASVVLGTLNAISVEISAILLGLGLSALAVAALVEKAPP